MFLYQLFDIQQAATTPFLFWTGTGLYDQSSLGIKQTKFRGTPMDVKEKNVAAHPFCNLVHFERATENKTIKERLKGDPKLLIIPPLSGHFASLLRDTVESMLPSHDVYITNWLDAKTIPLVYGSFNLEDQIKYITDIIRFLGPDLHILAVTQASFTTLAAVALLSADEPSAAPRSMTLIGGPIDARKSFVSLRELAKKRDIAWFNVNHIQLVPPYYLGAFRPVYPGFLQLQNRMALALENRSTEIVKYFQHLVRGDEETDETHQKLYDEFLTVMDIPAELYLQFIDNAYSKCSLATGEMTVHGKKVDLASITKTALLTVEAELDDLAPPEQTRAAHELCTGLPSHMKKARLEIGVGHYGVFSGKKWRNNIQPAIHQFIRLHAQSVDEISDY